MKRTILIAVVSLIGWLLVAPVIFPDPAQQVSRGYGAAREACIQGRAVNEPQRRLCRLLR